MGRVTACCRDESGSSILVDVARKVSQLSPHSSTWSVRSAAPCMWLMHEAINCVAWKVTGDEVIVIML